MANNGLSDGWDAPNGGSSGAAGSAGSTFDNSAPIGQKTYGYSTDEATIPVMVKRGIDRKTNSMFSNDPMNAKAEPARAMPVYQAVTAFESLPAADLVKVQQRLYAGGFYDKYLNKGEIPKFGQPDDDSVSAYMDAVRQTIRSNGAAPGNAGNGAVTLDDVIDNAAELKKALTTKPAKPPRLTNPQDVAATAQQEAQQILGQRVDDGTVKQLGDRYENLAQQQYQTASDAGTQYYNSPPSQAWIDEQLRQMLPQTTQAYQTSQNIGAFLKLVDSNGLFSAYHA